MIEKVVKDAVTANKYKSGTKEVLQSIKGSKLIIVSKSIEQREKNKLEEQAKSSSIPIYYFDGNSVQLGKLCNKPYRITTIALKSGDDDQIKSIFQQEQSGTETGTGSSKAGNK